MADGVFKAYELCHVYFIGSSDPAMVELRNALRARVLECKKNAWAQSTQRSYASYRKSYVEFCDKTGYVPVPVSMSQVCEYIMYLSDRLAYTSIEKYLGIIRVMHEELGYKNPKIMEDYNVKLVLLAVKKKLGAKVERKTAMTPELLLKMHLVL